MLELHCVKFDTRPAKKLLDKQTAVYVSKSQTIRLRGSKNMIGRNQASSAGHIFDNHSGVSRNMFIDMSREGSAIKVEASTGTGANDYSEGFAAIKLLLRGRRRSKKNCEAKGQPIMM